MKRGRLCLAATLVTITMASSVVLVARDSLVVRMRDKCDPATFNASAGPGTCVGDGNIAFAQFIRELTSAKKPARGISIQLLELLVKERFSNWRTEVARRTHSPRSRILAAALWHLLTH